MAYSSTNTGTYQKTNIHTNDTPNSQADTQAKPEPNPQANAQAEPKANKKMLLVVLDMQKRSKEDCETGCGKRSC